MRIITVFIITIMFSGLVSAQTVPVPQSKREAIGDLDARVERYKKEQKELEEKAQSIESDLNNTKDKLVEVAASIQKNESALQRIERQISDLEQDREAMQNSLEEDRKSIARLITALERIRRVPPEAMIARPEAPIDTARSAMLLGDILPAIHKQSQALKEKLQKLADLNADLQAKREDAQSRAADLKGEQDKLEKLVAERTQLFVQANADIKQR